MRKGALSQSIASRIPRPLRLITLQAKIPRSTGIACIRLYVYFISGKNTKTSHSFQSRVFELIGKSTSLAAMSGYNVSVFAYGQTGSGKTHTMLGGNSTDNDKARDERGLIPR
jgi:hypothetical protein